MPKFLEITLGGVDWMLLGDRGLYWHEHQTLFVADTHFGKEATFRRNGLPVPQGSTDGTLSKISNMLQQTDAARLVILGDMFHARSSLSTDVCESLDRFFAKHDGIAHQLIRGNHDAHVGQLPTHWPTEVVEAGHRIGNVILSHEPRSVDAASELALCGHLHPSVRCNSRNETLGKLPCFWFRQGCLVLPAIGEFTGTHAVQPGMDDRTWLILEQEVVEYRLPLIGR